MGNNLIRVGRRLCGRRRERSSQLKVTHLVHFFMFLMLAVSEVVKWSLRAEKEAPVNSQDLGFFREIPRAVMPVFSKDKTSRHLS